MPGHQFVDKGRDLSRDNLDEVQLQPSDIVDHCIGSGFDAIVIAIDGLMTGNLGAFEAVRLLLRDKQLNILAQRTLITFERQNVISLFVHDFLANFTLAPIASMIMMAPSIARMSRSFGIAIIALDFSPP